MSLSLKIIHFLGQIFWLIDTIFFQMKFPFTPVLFSLRIKAVNTVSWIGSSPSEYQHTNYENQQDKFVFWQGVKLYFCIYIRNFVQTADMCFISEIYLTQNNLPSGREHEESFYLISGDPFWLPPFWTRIMSEFQRNTKVNKKNSKWCSRSSIIRISKCINNRWQKIFSKMSQICWTSNDNTSKISKIFDDWFCVEKANIFHQCPFQQNAQCTTTLEGELPNNSLNIS